MESTITQWATILSPIIAVILALWTSRSGSRDTAKLIKYNKELMRINLQIKMLELVKEAEEEHVQFDLLFKQSKDLGNYIKSNYMDWPSETLRKYEEIENDLYDKKSLTFDKRMVIAKIMSDLTKLDEKVKKM